MNEKELILSEKEIIELIGNKLKETNHKFDNDLLPDMIKYILSHEYAEREDITIDDFLENYEELNGLKEDLFEELRPIIGEIILRNKEAICSTSEEESEE